MIADSFIVNCSCCLDSPSLCFQPAYSKFNHPFVRTSKPFTNDISSPPVIPVVAILFYVKQLLNRKK